MNVAELEKELAAGKVRPVYVVAGEERYLVDDAVKALRSKLVDPGLADFNEETLTAGEADVGRVIAAVRTAPMMADRRFVQVRAIERWEGKGGDDSKAGPLDRLADYAEKPISSTCLVLVGGKLDNRRRLVAAAKKGGYLVSCEPLDSRALASFIERMAAAKGHKIGGDVARHLAQIAGPELGYVADVLERLSLFVGKGAPITEQAVAEVVVKMRETSVYELVSAVGSRDLPRAMATLAEVYDPRDGGIGLVGLLAWSVRQVLRVANGLAEGQSPEEAAKAAGVPPFKVREVASQAKGLSPQKLERWLMLLAEADLALKSSRRPARAILDTLVLDLARAAA